jgi:hypothetical protein
MTFAALPKIRVWVEGLLPPLASCPRCGSGQARVQENHEAAWMVCGTASCGHAGPRRGTPREAWLAWNEAQGFVGWGDLFDVLS